MTLWNTDFACCDLPFINLRKDSFSTTECGSTSLITYSVTAAFKVSDAIIGRTFSVVLRGSMCV